MLVFPHAISFRTGQGRRLSVGRAFPLRPGLDLATKYDRGRCSVSEGEGGIKIGHLARVASQPAPSSESGLFVEQGLFQQAGWYLGAHNTTGRTSEACAPATPVTTGGINFTDGGGRGACLFSGR